MKKTCIRWMSLLLVSAISLSIFALPALAAGEDEEAEEEVITAAVADNSEASNISPTNILENVTASPAPTDDVSANTTAAVTDEGTGEITGVDEEAEQTSMSASLYGVEGGSVGAYTVTYYDSDGTVLSTESVASGASPAAVPEKGSSGKAISVWADASGSAADPASAAVTADVSYYAWYMPELNTTEHYRYINGTGNACFSPTSSLTRGQAAYILYQLLEDNTESGPYNCTFSDVSSSAYYYNAVKALASYGVLNGYDNGTFQPGNSVTRAEFVKMLVTLTGVTGSDGSFTDISGHWGKSYILAATAQGWLNGYTDGSFRPNNSITRAEAVVIVNRVLDRSADSSTIDSGTGILHYLDVTLSSSTSWYYYDVIEASVGHKYSTSSGSEAWTDYDIESTGLSSGVHQCGSVFCYIDANGQPTYLSAGINKINGYYLYAAGAGYSATVDLSSKPGYAVTSKGSTALSNGVQRIGSYYFYWDLSTNTPKYFSAGLTVVSGAGYWADSAGYALRHDLTAGVVSLGGKNYLAANAYTIATSGVAYSSATSTPKTVDLAGKTYEYNNNMYYVQSDYSLATDQWIGYLYFGTNCAYTSSDSTLDGYVWNVVKSFINSTSLTQEQKLLKAYYYIRGGEGSYYNTTVNGVTYGKSPFSYRPVGLVFSPARYNRQSHIKDFISCAKQMYSLGYGRCYEWASAYHYVARRLGFQTYLVVGRIWTNSIHCWNMIQWNGVWHISDVEIEWGYLSGYYSSGKIYRNLFDQTLSSESVTSYTNKDANVWYTFPS